MQIRYRNIVRDENNVIISGSAAIVENTYQRNLNGGRLRNHTKQKVVERLGKVIWMNDDNPQQGIFNSAARGLVFYDLNQDMFQPVDPSDERLIGSKFQKESEWIHTNFGNAFLFFNEMENTPLMNVLRATFTDSRVYEKVLAHIAHDCLKNGSSVKCGEYLKSSVLSYVLKDINESTLDCDTEYFTTLANDNLKVTFFKNLVAEMRKIHPEFGRCCYTDSTPLPGDAKDNPFLALCSHGTDGSVIQARLVLILDISTMIPVWFEIIPSNVLDKSTIITITEDVKATLGIDIDVYNLDAGYARQELFQLFNRNSSTHVDENGIIRERSVLVRMPDINGYGRNDLYIQCKPHIYNGRYSFDYEHHTFFGERVEIELFDCPEFAYVFVDKTQAESLLRGWRERHLEEWNALSDLSQDWYQVKDGFFVLIGNKEQTPRDTLIEYRGRVHIEGFFRDGKTYLKILPIAKWNKETVVGKIFHDIIETTFYRAYRKQVKNTNMSMSSLIVSLNGWEACKLSEGLVEIKTPNAQVRAICESLGYIPPAHWDLDAFRDQIFTGTRISLEPVTRRSKRKKSNEDLALSPEEKLEANKQAKISRMTAKEEQKRDSAEKKAADVLSKAKKGAESRRNKLLDKAKMRLDKAEAEAKRETTKEKARAVYETEVAKVMTLFEQTIAKAEAIYEQAKAEAEEAFEKGVSDIVRSFECAS